MSREFKPNKKQTFEEIKKTVGLYTELNSAIEQGSYLGQPNFNYIGKHTSIPQNSSHRMNKDPIPWDPVKAGIPILQKHRPKPIYNVI